MSEDISSNDYICPSMSGSFIKCRYWVESELLMNATSCFNTWPKVEMEVSVFPAALGDVGLKNQRDKIVSHISSRNISIEIAGGAMGIRKEY